MKKSKKTFQRLTALLLSLALCLLSVPIASAGADNALSDDPVIILPGYTSSGLVKVAEDGSTERVWHVDFDGILQTVLERIVDVAAGLGLAASGADPAYLARVIGEESYAFLDGVRCEPDGSSTYHVERVYSEPETTNNAYYRTHPDVENGTFEKDIMGDIGKLIGDDKIFNFNCDFRMGAIACAEQLQEYILKVLAYTGRDRVNLISISHGGQVAGTYLSLYGTQGLVNNAVLIVPALGGAGIAYDLLNNSVDFDEDTLVRFVQHGTVSETDYQWLVRAEATGFLDDVIHELVPYLLDSVLYWGSIWDFIPCEYYETLKARLLDADASAALIEKSDRMHREIMPHYAENFAACRAAGVNIHIIAGTDEPIVTGLQQNSDAIITTTSSTGAYTAPYGQRFADGYRPRGTVCSDSSHRHVSPAMTVDASTAYLPENTFFVEGLFHGMAYWDDYTSDLLEILLLTDSITDVYSDPAYPQFHATTNAEQAVTAYFDKSPEGYVGADDRYLIVKNLSKTYDLTLISVDTAGLGVLIPTLGDRLAPGESVRLALIGELRQVSLAKGQIALHYYTSLKTGTPVGQRVMNFTIFNGAPAAFDPEKPFVDAAVLHSSFEEVAGDRAASVLDRLGLRALVEMFFDTIYTIIKNIRLLFSF